MTCSTHGRPCVSFCLGVLKQNLAYPGNLLGTSVEFESSCLSVLCSSCPMQNHSNHKMIQLDDKTSIAGSDVRAILNSEQKDLQTVKEVLKRNKEMLIRHQNASLAVLNTEMDALMKYFEDLKEQVKSNFSHESQKLNFVEAKLSECSLLGREALQKTSGFSSVYTFDLKKLETFSKYAAEFKDSRFTEIACFGMALPPHQDLVPRAGSVKSYIGTLRKVPVGESKGQAYRVINQTIPQRRWNNCCSVCGREKKQSSQLCRTCLV